MYTKGFFTLFAPCFEAVNRLGYLVNGVIEDGVPLGSPGKGGRQNQTIGYQVSQGAVNLAPVEEGQDVQPFFKGHPDPTGALNDLALFLFGQFV